MDDHEALTDRLHHLGTTPIDPARAAADLAAMAAAGGSSRWRSTLRSGPRVAAAFLAGLVLGSTGLAAADALPDPAQHVAHTVLARVGVDVPNPERYHGPECGAEVRKNHGAYVRDDHALAQTECGKPVGADKGHDPADGTPGAGAADKGPCHGKPPWAGHTTMTPAELDAAKAERAALCGNDDDADVDAQDDADGTDPGDAVEPEAEDEGEATTTSTPEVTTTTPTTEAPTTTTTASTTTTTT